jgi:hypothetical protein
MNYVWNSASGADVPDIVAMALAGFGNEIDAVFEPDTIAYARNITHAIVNQFYNPQTEFVKVARSLETNAICAYVWVIRGQTSPWSDEEMATVRIAHLDLELPPRLRIGLVNDMIAGWESWARYCGVPIMCSTTMRRETTGFLRLHERNGYDVRGSFAYKRLIEKGTI